MKTQRIVRTTIKNNRIEVVSPYWVEPPSLRQRFINWLTRKDV